MKSVDKYVRCAVMAAVFSVSVALSSVAQAQDPSPEVASAAAAMLRDYEQIRSALAADDGGPVSRPAQHIASRARGVQSDASAATGRLLRAIRDTAARLGRVDGDDLPALRRGFGALSAAFLALIEAHSGLGRGLHVFVCPMTEGDNQWLQPASQIENPYMGQRMLQCGRPIE